MRITRDRYHQIMRLQRELPPETGGILGGKNGVVTANRFDEGVQSDKLCSYIPDVKTLNAVIKQWQRDGICFMGIYHTHFWNVDTLSEGDLNYIGAILNNMPPEIERLYFPLVVMPRREMICYTAALVSGKPAVRRDALIIV